MHVECSKHDVPWIFNLAPIKSNSQYLFLCCCSSNVDHAVHWWFLIIVFPRSFHQLSNQLIMEFTLVIWAYYYAVQAFRRSNDNIYSRNDKWHNCIKKQLLSYKYVCEHLLFIATHVNGCRGICKWMNQKYRNRSPIKFS